MEPARERRPLDMDRVVAEMCSASGYPALAPQILSGEIVAPLFWMLARRMQAVLALGAAQVARGAMVGTAVAWNGKAAVPAYESLMNEAHPDG